MQSNVLLGIWLLLCLISFCQFGIDKKRARQGRWRIPEKTLFITAAIGGSVGAILGMHVFRHKTKHASFRFGLPAILLVQLLLLTAIFWHFR